MFRITAQTPRGEFGGQWRVLPGNDHAPKRGDNGNLFFATRRAALAKCRELNA